MRNLRSTLIAFALLTSMAATPALAVDNMMSKDAPDLASVRTKIKAKDWKAAIT